MRAYCVGLVAGLALLTAAPVAWACSVPWTNSSALPFTGARGIAPQSSLVLITSSTSPPTDFSLEANGAPVSLLAAAQLGHGIYGGGVAKNARAIFWSVNAGLQPSTNYVLRQSDGTLTTEVTRFSTGTSADAQPGRAPVLQELRLWRVRYPTDDLASSCVGGEYEGYVDINYQDGSIPGTPLPQTVSIITLTPRAGGTSQSFVFSGVSHFVGTGAAVKPDERPDPTLAVWKPLLDPDTDYCATMTVFGRNDLATGPVTSNRICAGVKSMDAPGAVGCNVGGRGSCAGLAGALLALALLRIRHRTHR